jgi:MFS family permease
MPSKLQNVLGLAFQTLSMALIGTIKLLAVPDQMWIVCLGLVIQGIASPCIAISVMPSVLDIFQLHYNLHPEIDNKAYGELCDKVSNILELCFAGFFLFGSFFGEYLNELIGSQLTFEIFFISGLFFTFIFFVFDCGFNVFKENKEF